MRIAVVGAGVTGLVVARELLRRGHKVTLIERDIVGGLAAGFPYPGNPNVYLERFYHHIFRSDTLVQQLVWEAGLERNLIWRPTLSGVIASGKPWPMRGPVDLLRFRPVGTLADRLRLGWALFRLRRVAQWQELDGVTCREFFARHGAQVGYERLWLPLLFAKFARYGEEASAAFLWGRIVPRSTSRRWGQECLGYLRGGFQRLFQHLADELRQAGCQVIVGQNVTAVVPGSPCRIELQGHCVECDRIVWTASLGLLANLVGKSQAAAVTGNLPQHPYVAATVLILAMRRSQSPFYWLNNIDRDITFGAVIEHTHLADPADYGGEHILYVVNYHEIGDKRFAVGSPEELLKYHEPSLRRIFPGFDHRDISRMFLCQAPFASPVYTKGFGKKMPAYRGLLPGIDICNMQQVYPFDRNMNHCVQNALTYVHTCYDAPVSA
ncbi:MAG: FAD-dependent oxidoreductase [Thermoguttaceae bacterium]|nr:FAD-dependent oxidoreductase [Thermoguttaceae bacterium]MDW8078059.1 FAD-dependent oxidoreductase [Thermoguttaceae bacterium]